MSWHPVPWNYLPPGFGIKPVPEPTKSNSSRDGIKLPDNAVHEQHTDTQSGDIPE